MPGKDIGPLQQTQKDVDVLKKKVDSTVKESEKSIKNLKLKDRDVKLTELFSSCTDLTKEVNDHLKKVNDLKEENEPKAVKSFENKKTNESKRLEQFLTRLDAALIKFPEEAKPKPQEESQVEEDEETEDGEEEDEETGEEGESVDGEEHEEDEEDGEETEEDEDSPQPSTSKKPSPENVAKKPEVKVSVSKEMNKVEEGSEEEEEDDEESGEEEDEEESEEEDDEEDEEEDEEEEEGSEEDDDEDLELTSTMRLFEAISDYTAEQPEDLGFKEGEVLTILNTRQDGWWEAENNKGVKGLVPKTYLKLHNKYKNLQEAEDGDEEPTSPTGKKSAKEMWKGIRTALKETSVSDVLHAMGAVPSGFRNSTLAQKFDEDSYRMKHCLSPKLSTSNVTFRDLFLDPSKNKIRPRAVWIEKMITVVHCRQIPVPGAGLEVLDRFVRVCLFDGENILSNIHCIKVASVDRSQRSWNFSTRMSDLMDTFQHAEVFVRTPHNVTNLGLLFELAIVYQRTSTGETGELSCGWSVLPLVENDGSCALNRGYDMYVHGGSPYERGVEVDPSISRRAASSAFMSLVSGNKQPRILARVTNLKQVHTEWIQNLPDTIVGNVALLNFYSYHRQLLADCLLRDRLDLESTEPLHSPVLVNFPNIADIPDLMSFFRVCWQEQVKTVSRSDKRDEEYIKKMFTRVFMECVYPICFSSNFPKYKSGDMQVTKERAQEIYKFKQYKQDQKSMLAALCSADMNFEPFQTSEVSFSVIGRHCMDRPIYIKAN